MAISVISTVPGSFGTAANNASVTVPLNGTTVAGDLKLVFGANRTTNNALSVSGFSSKAFLDRVGAWSATAGAGDGSPTLSITGGSLGDTVQGLGAVIRGMIAGGTLDQTAVTQTNSPSQTSIATPSYTPNNANCILFMVVHWLDDCAAFGAPTSSGNWISLGFQSTTTGGDATLAVYYQIQTISTAIPSGTIAITTGASSSASRVIIFGFQQEPPPSSGKSEVTIAGLPWADGAISILEGLSSPAANGDIIEIDDYTEQGNPITCGTDGVVVIDVSGDGVTRQSFEARVRVSGVWSNLATFYVNNRGPEIVDTTDGILYEFEIGEAITEVELGELVSHAEGDALVVTGTPPTGLSLASDGSLTGTPTVAADSIVQVTYTDLTGESLFVYMRFRIGSLAPMVEGELLATGVAAFEALGAVVTQTVSSSGIVSIGDIISQSIQESQIVVPGDEVTLVYSYSSNDVLLQDLLDPGDSLKGVLIARRADAGSVISYYCIPIQISRGRSMWVDVPATMTDTEKAAAILEALEIPDQPDSSLIN